MNKVKEKHISKLKLLSFYVIMIGLTIVVCFALLEFGLARYYQSTESRIPITTFDPTLGWRLRPGSHSNKPSYTFKHHQVSINEYGLRNRPVSARATSDTKRIVILGDSFTFAMAVPNEKSFPVILENILSGSGHYEVINAGVPGYGTAQEMLLMKELTGKKVVGDVYVLMISINDILDNLRLGEYGSTEKAPAQPGFELGEDGTLKRTHYPQKQYSSNFVPRPTSRFYTVEVVNSRLRILLQTMPRFVNLLGRFGIQPKVPRMPSLIYGWYVDLLTILIQNNAKELYIPVDGHFSNEGHAIVAQQLATFVIKHSGVTRTQTSLENPSKAMSQDAAILLPDRKS